MGLADLLRKSVLNEFPDEVYDLVAEELLAGQRDEGMWVKSLALANGNESEAKSAYIKLRAYRIAGDISKQREQQARERERQRVERAAVAEKAAEEAAKQKEIERVAALGAARLAELKDHMRHASAADQEGGGAGYVLVAIVFIAALVSYGISALP